MWMKRDVSDCTADAGANASETIAGGREGTVAQSL
jgi:hypothetical protein